MDSLRNASTVVPFSFFVSLLHEISKIPPRKATSTTDQRKDTYPVLQILKRWISELRKRYAPLPEGTATSVFRLLFPEDDPRRKYDLQETKLARYLVKCLGVSMQPDRVPLLTVWNGENTSGCLGDQVRMILERTSTTHVDDDISSLSITDVDVLLDELASTSTFSDGNILCQYSTTPPRSKQDIITTLYRNMPPLDASFLTQIILKDLRPVLYPLSESHYTVALRSFNSNAVTMLKKEDAMKAWDPSGRLLKTYRLKSNLDEAIKQFETGLSIFAASPIEIPKSVKGRGCCDALRYFDRSNKVWAETKYDGERCQLHVEIQADGSSRVTIFSKSKRDSTLDRYGIHQTIRDALRLPRVRGSVSGSHVKHNVVLDAEMVAFSDRLNRIDEFWRIRSLIESTARGPRATRARVRAFDDDADLYLNSQSSLISNASDNGTRHLALVFFDVLVLDSSPLLSESYSTRRSILESLIQIIPGQVILANRTPIDLGCTSGKTQAEQDLRKAFARLIADHQEGVVLKAEESRYNDFRLPWVKLKKDYIPGYGDTLDLVILGAAWDKHRARELRVGPTTYTTFYVGVLNNSPALNTDSSLRPHFEVYFTVSYGLSREQLEEFNFLIKNSDPIQSRMPPEDLGFTFTLLSSLTPPAVIFRKPLLVEMFGAGFTKAPSSKHYELRFPRITKIFRSGERDWLEGVPLPELHAIARQAVGRDRSYKDVDDWANDLFGKPSSPGVKCANKKKAAEAVWEQKLRKVDKKVKRNSKTSAYSFVTDGNIQSADGMLSRSARGLKPLGSMTNVEEIVRIPPYEEEHHRSPRDGNIPAPVLLMQATTLSCSERPPAYFSRTTVTQNSFPSTIPVFCIEETTNHAETTKDTVEPESRSRGLKLSPEPVIRAPGMSLDKFLANALVWIAKTCNSSRPSCRPLCKAVIPPNNRIHSLDSLLIGCGWHVPETGPLFACGWVERGVLFLDNNLWKDHILRILEEKRTQTDSKSRKPIWVFDSKCLALTAGECMEVHALSVVD